MPEQWPRAIYVCPVCGGVDTVELRSAITDELRREVEALHLHDNTGDPVDLGYMNALSDVLDRFDALGIELQRNDPS